MKRLLLTGGTGFLGRQIVPLLRENYMVTTLGRSEGNDIVCDLSKAQPSLSDHFDLVVHAAGKAHSVPKNQEEEREFFATNYEGTVRLCSELVAGKAPDTFIFISSSSVYGMTTGVDVDENAPLHGETAYAKSKIMAEEYLVAWSKKQGVKLVILRPSLICGPNPPGNLGSMIRGLRKGLYLSIAGGKAKKSVVMGEDIGRLIPLCENKEGVYNVCDDSQPTFRELERLICRQLGKHAPLNIPLWMAKGMAMMGDALGGKVPLNSARLDKIVLPLTFCNEKAKRELGWVPVSVMDNFKIV